MPCDLRITVFTGRQEAVKSKNPQTLCCLWKNKWSISVRWKTQRKKSITPVTAMTAPVISFQLSFSLKMITAGGMISTGTIAMMVAAIPARVCCTANSENETPRKGPKMEPRVIRCMADRFFRALKICDQRFVKKKMMKKPMIPVITLICVEAKAS